MIVRNMNSKFRILPLLFIVFVTFLPESGIYAQIDSFSTINLSGYKKQNLDSFNLWRYQIIPSNEKLMEAEICMILFQRTEYVFDKTKDYHHSDSLLPQITFRIFPKTYTDTLSKITEERTMMLSCCWPICGFTMETIDHFVFWADAFSITCAFSCNGIDYTRGNINKILNTVMNKDYKTVEDLLTELPIGKIALK